MINKGLALWQRITATLVTSIIVLILGIASAVWLSLDKAGQRIEQESQRILSDQTELFLETLVRERSENLDSNLNQARSVSLFGAYIMSKTMEKQGFNHDAVKDVLSSLYNRTNHCANTYFINNNKEITAFPIPIKRAESVKRKFLPDSSYHKLYTRNTFWSDVHVNPFKIHHDMVIDAIAPVYVLKQLEGYVGISFSITDLMVTFNQFQPVLGGYSFILDTHSRLIGAPPQARVELSSPSAYKSRGFINLKNTDNPELDDILQKMVLGESRLRKVRIKGEFKYLAYHPIRNMNWRLGLVVPVRMITAVSAELVQVVNTETGEIMMAMVFWGSIFIAVAIFSGILLARQLTRPIREMSIIAEDIANGNLDRQVHTNRQDEIGVLGNSFNIMTNRIRQMIVDLNMINSELNRKNSVLEQEISDRKQTEASLRESEDRFRRLAENAKDIIFQMSLENGRFVYVSPASKELLGYEPEEIYNTPNFIKRIVHPDWYEYVMDQTKKILKGEKVPSTAEYMVIHKSGRTLWMNQRNMVIYDEDNQPLALEGIITDVTERKKNEKELEQYRENLEELIKERTAALQESEDRFRTIFEYAPVMIDSFDKNGNCLLWNKECEKVLGWSKDEVDALENVFSMFYPDPKKQKEVLKSIEDADGIFREFRPRTKYGTERVLTWGNIRLPNHTVISVGHDITEHKQVEKALMKAKEEAELASSAKSMFLANVSHEIRTPLNAIIGFSELLTSLITNPKEKKYLDSIRSAAKSLLTLINDILDLTKIESGKMKIKAVPVDPQLLFEEIKRIFGLKLSEKKLDLIIDIDPDMTSEVMLDETRIRQVLLNLVGNAVKFTEKGYIKLSMKILSQEKSRNLADLEILVQDSGIGIPEVEKERIFESFKQRYGQSTRKYGGTGLGLSISKRLVEMMGGSIFVESQLGKGSLFKVVLKGVELVSGVSTIRTGRNVTTNILFKNANVLVIDEVESNRESLNEMLTDMGLTVSLGQNSEEALILAAETKPDVIFLNIMPIKNGLETITYLKEDPKIAEIPVVAMSVNIDDKDRLGVLNSGFKGCLLQPIEKKQLLIELKKYIQYSEEISSKSAYDYIERFKEEIGGNEITDYQNLADTMQKEFSSTIKTVSSVGKMSKIKNMGLNLSKLGKNHHVKTLVYFGEELFQFAENYDIVQIDGLLKELPILIEIITANIK